MPSPANDDSPEGFSFVNHGAVFPDDIPRYIYIYLDDIVE
jgi:hypothetical protein